MDSPPPAGFELLLWVVFVGSLLTCLFVFWLLFARRSLVPYEPALEVPWSGRDVFLLVFLLIMFDALALGATDTSEGGTISPRAVAVASATHLAWLIFALRYLSTASGAYVDDLGFDYRRLGRDVRLGLAAFLAAVLPVNGLHHVLTHWFPSEHPLQKLTEEQGSTGVLWLATVAAVFVAPLFEEFLFRVLLQGWLQKKEADWRQNRPENRWVGSGGLSVIVVAALFALLHAGHGPDPIPLFLMALILGYLYRQTHRIWASWVMHASFNAMAIGQLWVMFG